MRKDTKLILESLNKNGLKEDEDIYINELIKKLEDELLNKEISLLDLDNKIQTITGSSTSLFDYNECIEQDSCAYYIDEDQEIVVGYNFIEDKSKILEYLENNDFDNLSNSIVKVSSIFKL